MTNNNIASSDVGEKTKWPIIITRKDLYDQVWSTPMRLLAKKFGLSDVGLAKVCRKHDIPRPSVGYWAKKQHGKKTTKPSLPPAGDPKLETIKFEKPTPSPFPARPKRSQPPRDADVAAALAAVNELPPIVVGDTLENPHKLVVATEKALRQSFKAKPVDQYGLFAPAGDSPTLDILTSVTGVPRALRLANAVLVNAVAAGFRIECTDESGCAQVWINVLDEQFSLSLRERTNQVPHVITKEEETKSRKWRHLFQPPAWDYKPTGNFTLRICREAKYSAVKTWIDDKRRKRLEDQIGAVLKDMVWTVQEERLRREEDERRELARREAEHRAWEARRRREEWDRLTKSLLRQAKNWRDAVLLRKYADSIEAILRESGSDLTDKNEKWLRLVHKVAERLDPATPIRKAHKGRNTGSAHEDRKGISNGD